MTVVECIHGLELSQCEACSPRQAPERPTVRTVTPRASRPVAGQKPRPLLAARSAESRRYLVVPIGDLADLLAEPLGEDAEWRLDMVAPTDREQVVVVATLADPDGIQLLGVANEPARRRVADVLGNTDRSPRIVINPAWFA